MGQLVFISDDGWCCIYGPSKTKLHYYTADQSGLNFPVPACRMFRTAEDVHLATQDEIDNSQCCKSCQKVIGQK